MRAELRCEVVRSEISAFLDHELPAEERSALTEHLSTCAGCRAYRDSIERVRAAARIRASDAVPNLVPEVMARIEPAPRRTWMPQVRTAAIAAAAAALLVLGASLPWETDRSGAARAAAISRSVKQAAATLDTYRARFRIQERGWHRALPVRRFVAEVWFDTPERFRLSLRDLTTYPSATWPRNDVDVVANGRKWWIREPSTCPTAALPGCVPTRRIEERTLVRRQPFDGATRFPTDIALPLETLADVEGVRSLGTETVLGRTAVRVALPYHRAIPLVSALQVGGSWREFHPADVVHIWLDEQTWFPLRFRVVAGSSPGRDLWADRTGSPTDEPGTVLYGARAMDFAEPGRFSPNTFTVPTTGTVQSGRFRPIPFERAADIRPDFVAGLTPHRAGTAARGQKIVSFARGMTFLRVTRQPQRGLRTTYMRPAATVGLGAGGVGLYEPATTGAGRRIELFTGEHHFVVESNLARPQLLDVARSLNVRSRLPDRVRTPSGTVERVPAGTQPAEAEPGWLPPGYAASATFLSRSDGNTTYTAYFLPHESNFTDDAIRIVHSRGVDALTPSGEVFFSVNVRGATARFSFERSELEWIEGDVYRAIRVPGADLATAVRIARGLG